MQAVPTTEDRRTTRAAHRSATTTHIRAAALRVVRRHGLEHVTVEMICAEAGISVRTFFNYFRYKEAALVCGPPPLTDEATAAFLAGREGDRPATSVAEVLAEVEELLVTQVREVAATTELLATTFRMVDEYPQLLAPHLATFATIERQLGALIEARMDAGASAGAGNMAPRNGAPGNGAPGNEAPSNGTPSNGTPGNGAPGAPSAAQVAERRRPTSRLIAAVAIATVRVALNEWARHPDQCAPEEAARRGLRAFRRLIGGHAAGAR